MATKLYTFHKVIAECERGGSEGWRAFLADYNPIFFQLSDQYLAGNGCEREAFWRESLAALAAENSAQLKKLAHQSELEFLIDFRDFLLRRGAPSLDAGVDASGVPPPSLEKVSALLQGLPLLHQAVVFLKMCGYSDSTLEKILVVTPAVAQKGIERLQPEYAGLLGRAEDRCMWPAALEEVLFAARAAKGEDCIPPREFVRMAGGGFSWYDKDPAEEHSTRCLRCLECWVALREIKHWRREAKPQPVEEIERLLSTLPFLSLVEPRKSFLARMFSG